MNYALSEAECEKKKLKNSSPKTYMNNIVPVYIVSGFLGSGKTEFMNSVLKKRNKEMKILCVQFEHGNSILNKDNNFDVLSFSIRDIQQEDGYISVAKKLNDYFSENTVDEVWVEWNGILPISDIEDILLYNDHNNKIDLRNFCRIEKVIFIAKCKNVINLIAETGGSTFDQIKNCDVIVIDKDEGFKKACKNLKIINPGVKICINNNEKDIEKNVNDYKMNYMVTLSFVVFCFLFLYVILNNSIAKDFLNSSVNIFLGIIFQALPFLLIGILLSSAIQVFVSSDFIEKHFPKRRITGLLLSSVMGFCLPVCDCASVPVFKSLIKKGIPVTSAVAFMMATPVINPVVILSTWFAFGGNIKIVLCRIILGIICSWIIGLTFIKSDASSILNSNIIADNIYICSCNVNNNDNSDDFKSKIKSFINHAQSDFFSVGKFLIIGAVVSSVVQLLGKNINWTTESEGMFLPLLIMIIMAFCLSLCSSSDAVVAKSFMTQFSLGSIMGFLVFGPMMDIKNLIMLSGSFSKKFVIRLLFTTFIVCFIVVYVCFSFGLGELL